MARRMARATGPMVLVAPFAALALASCGGKEVERPRLDLALPAATDQVARAGTYVVTRGMLEAAVRARAVSKEVALRELLDDAVLAQVGASQALDLREDVRRNLDAALARQVVRRLREAAEAKGPLSDEELRELTAKHWREVDLPERVRVVHLVVRRPASSADNARAERAAAAIREVLLQANTADDFLTLAKRAAAEQEKTGLKVVAERLPAFAHDGRSYEGDDGAMDGTFAAAAFALPVGGTSVVAETTFGWHVIRCVERLAAMPVSAERRRELFRPEALAQRARKSYEAVVKARQSATPPRRETYLETALASVPLSSEVTRP